MSLESLQVNLLICLETPGVNYLTLVLVTVSYNENVR